MYSVHVGKGFYIMSRQKIYFNNLHEQNYVLLVVYYNKKYFILWK